LLCKKRYSSKIENFISFHFVPRLLIKSLHLFLGLFFIFLKLPAQIPQIIDSLEKLLPKTIEDHQRPRFQLFAQFFGSTFMKVISLI